MEYTPANIITLGRFFSIGIIAVLIYFATPATLWWAAVIFILAAGSDWLDGYVARRTKISDWGIAMDPIGDKLLVVITLYILANMGAFSTLGIVAGTVIVAREIFIPGLREFLLTRDIKTPVTKLAKWKTAAQLFSLAVFLVGLALTSSWLRMAGEILLAIAAVLTAITGWQYHQSGMGQNKAKKAAGSHE